MPNTDPVIDSAMVVEGVVKSPPCRLLNVIPVGAITRGQRGRVDRYV